MGVGERWGGETESSERGEGGRGFVLGQRFIIGSGVFREEERFQPSDGAPKEIWTVDGR